MKKNKVLSTERQIKIVVKIVIATLTIMRESSKGVLRSKY